jgi:hypothetical protein
VASSDGEDYRTYEIMADSVQTLWRLQEVERSGARYPDDDYEYLRCAEQKNGFGPGRFYRMIAGAVALL